MSSQNMKEEKEELMDINKVSEQDMLARKVSKSYVSKNYGIQRNNWWF